MLKSPKSLTGNCSLIFSGNLYKLKFVSFVLNNTVISRKRSMHLNGFTDWLEF